MIHRCKCRVHGSRTYKYLITPIIFDHYLEHACSGRTSPLSTIFISATCIIINSLYPIETEGATAPHSRSYKLTKSIKKRSVSCFEFSNRCITPLRRVTIAYLILHTYLNTPSIYQHRHDSTTTHISAASSHERREPSRDKGGFCLQHMHTISGSSYFLFPFSLYMIRFFLILFSFIDWFWVVVCISSREITYTSCN